MVWPGKRLSLQSHRKRSEHWFIASGAGRVTRGDEVLLLPEGGSIDIPLGAKHRVENPGTADLVVIEVQRGEYVGEDDIERFDDDFGRA